MRVGGQTHFLSVLHHGKCPEFSLNQVFGRSQSRSESGGQETNFCRSRKSNTCPLLCSLSTILIEVHLFTLKTKLSRNIWPSGEASKEFSLCKMRAPVILKVVTHSVLKETFPCVSYHVHIVCVCVCVSVSDVMSDNTVRRTCLQK